MWSDCIQENSTKIKPSVQILDKYCQLSDLINLYSFLKMINVRTDLCVHADYLYHSLNCLQMDMLLVLLRS